MLKISETRNVSGQVMIGEGENSKQVAYLNASVSKDGNVNINKSIQDCRMAAHNIVPVQIHSPTDISGISMPSAHRLLPSENLPS